MEKLNIKYMENNNFCGFFLTYFLKKWHYVNKLVFKEFKY